MELLTFFFLLGLIISLTGEDFENIFVVQQDYVVKFLYVAHLSDNYFPPSTIGLYYTVWSSMVVM